jgi:hypothetical protein
MSTIGLECLECRSLDAIALPSGTAALVPSLRFTHNERKHFRFERFGSFAARASMAAHRTGMLALRAP